MKILAIESSGLVASAAVAEDDKVLASYTVNFKKTHSQTLLPMIDEIKKILELDLGTLDAIAVSKGPGSFTGLRIGSATAKGLCLALGKPMIEISTLEAMAYQLYPADGIICPMMDARRSQVYTALYRFEGEKLVSIMPDSAMAVTELIDILNEKGEQVTFLGDGVPVYKKTVEEKLTVPRRYAFSFQNRQNAAALAILAEEYAARGEFTDPDMHAPEYLRMSQAERERLEKLGKTGKN